MMDVSVASACFNVFVRGRFYKLPWPRKPSPSPPNFRLRVSLGKRNLLYTAAHCTSFKQLHDTYKVRSVSVRCEQSTNGGNSVDVWLGRLAIVGFASAISVEIGSWKGLLEVHNVEIVT